jgi:hypothetical protein
VADHRHRHERARLPMIGHHRSNVDVGQRVAIDDDERARVKKR